MNTRYDGPTRISQETVQEPSQRAIVSIPVTQIGTTTTTLLTVQADRFVHLQNMSAFAPATTTLNVYFVPAGGTAGATNLAYSGSITGNAIVFDNKREMLDPGDTVQADVSTGTANIRLWGAQVSGGDPL